MSPAMEQLQIQEGRGSPLQQTDRAKGTTQHQDGHDMRQPQVPIHHQGGEGGIVGPAPKGLPPLSQLPPPSFIAQVSHG
ncbi:hypothetical protein BM1_10446 [Bipolaris maydis]|nr:hypothetical protein BM1_10446 [Bipolaris maydis]